MAIDRTATLPLNYCSDYSKPGTATECEDRMLEANSQQQQFETLMSQLATGSEEAAWQIAETYTPHILRAVRAKLPAAIRPKLDSQDFAQIVWASLLLKRSSLSRVKTPAQLVALLASVAHHKVIDAYRHYTTSRIRDLRRETPLGPLVETTDQDPRIPANRAMLDRGPTPSQMAGVRERWQSVSDRLSQRDREILRLRMKGLSYIEVAEKTGTSNATVRRVLAHVIELLRK